MQRFIDPHPLHHIGVGLAVMGVSIVLTALLVAFQLFAVRESGSNAIRADLLHYASDLLTNLAVIVAMVAEENEFAQVMLGFIVFDGQEQWEALQL